MRIQLMKSWNGAHIHKINLGQIVHGLRCEHPECKKPLNPKRIVYEVDGGLIIGSCCIHRGIWNRLDSFFGVDRA